MVRTKMNSWMKALTEFNSNNQKFCIPKKNSSEYKDIRKRQAKIEKERGKTQKKSSKPSKSKPKKPKQSLEDLEKEFLSIFPKNN